MKTTNPFPGMNPFFEQRWRDAHTSLITYLRDCLQERLPADLVACAEAETVALGVRPRTTTYRPDVQVLEPWALKEPSATVVAAPITTPIPTNPIRVLVEEEIERWIEIRDVAGRLITVLELLSPTNKLEEDERDRYRRKHGAFLGGGANLVELDLVRSGRSVFPGAVQAVLRQAGACYGVCVFRAAQPVEHEVHPIRLRERLPAIRVPLRPTDSDVVVDLQALINQCHERGRYHLLDYRLGLSPPLEPEEATWLDQLLREHGLR